MRTAHGVCLLLLVRSVESPPSGRTKLQKQPVDLPILCPAIANGDAVAQQVVRAHNRIVREALTKYTGKEIKHTGDGIMASFSTTSNGVAGAMEIQVETAKHNVNNPDLPLHIKIGINAGEPISEDNDLFGSTVQMAARIVDKAKADQIFVSEIVRGICAGKEVKFENRGPYEMKGFEDPPILYEVVWNG